MQYSSMCCECCLCVYIRRITTKPDVVMVTPQYETSSHKIEITTTTRELLLEEAPEMFDVRAFDEEGTQLCVVLLSSVHVHLRSVHS